MSEILFYIVIFWQTLSRVSQGLRTILAMPFSIHLVGYLVAKPVLNVLGIIAGIYVVVVVIRM